MAELNYKITAKAPDSVTLYLVDVGAFKMTAEGAAYLAQQLLEAANVAKPGSGGFTLGGRP